MFLFTMIAVLFLQYFVCWLTQISIKYFRMILFLNLGTCNNFITGPLKKMFFFWSERYYLEQIKPKFSTLWKTKLLYFGSPFVFLFSDFFSQARYSSYIGHFVAVINFKSKKLLYFLTHWRLIHENQLETLFSLPAEIFQFHRLLYKMKTKYI